jgi:acetoacetyl-CoA synthetase
MTAPHRPQIRLYQEWLQANRGLSFDSYDALWQWSVTDLDAFWQSIWDYFDLQSPTPYSTVQAVNSFATSVHSHPSAPACKVMLPAVSYAQ